MAERSVFTVIDADKCTGCGLCVAVCPSRTLSLRDGKAVVSGERSLSCGHCAAVCPTGAVTVRNLDPDLFKFSTFDSDRRWLPHGAFDTAQLVRLMDSRRSCRNFLDRPVDRALLDDLVRIGITAPSGTNSQPWTFTILPDRESVVVLGEQVAAFFSRVNRTAEKAWLRKLLRFIGKPELDLYHRDYLQSVTESLMEWENKIADRLFHGSTAVIVVGSKPGGSTSAEDALLAAQNMLLAAHSMGLGSCLIGFAVLTMMRDRRAKRAIGIPDEEKVHAVIALGYPNERYLRTADRKKPLVRVFETASRKETERRTSPPGAEP